MTYEQYCPSSSTAYFLHFPNRFLLKLRITYSQDLIDNKNFRFKVSRHRKTESNSHSRRIPFYRRINIALTTGEINDFIKLACNLSLAHTHDSPIHEDILASSHLRMETRTHLKERTDTATGTNTADSWAGYF